MEAQQRSETINTRSTQFNHFFSIPFSGKLNSTLAQSLSSRNYTLRAYLNFPFHIIYHLKRCCCQFQKWKRDLLPLILQVELLINLVTGSCVSAKVPNAIQKRQIFTKQSRMNGSLKEQNYCRAPYLEQYQYILVKLRV